MTLLCMVRSDGNEVDRWRGGKMGSDESKMETMITDDNEVQSAISEKNPKQNSTKKPTSYQIPQYAQISYMCKTPLEGKNNS